MTDLLGTGITVSDGCNSWNAENFQHPLGRKKKGIIFYPSLQNKQGTNKLIYQKK